MKRATATHNATVTPVSRRTFDVAFVVHIARCCCGWKVEHRDAERARRDALRHGAMK